MIEICFIATDQWNSDASLEIVRYFHLGVAVPVKQQTTREGKQNNQTDRGS